MQTKPKLKDILKGESLYSPKPRFVTVFEAIEADGEGGAALPALEVEVSYLSDKMRKDLIEEGKEKGIKVNEDTFLDVLSTNDAWAHMVAARVLATKRWRGATHANLMRYSEKLFLRADQLADLPNPLPFPEDEDDLFALFEAMPRLATQAIIGSFNLEKWAALEVERAKNEPAPTLASS